MSDGKRFYDKKIKYLEEMADGERLRCVGFVKAEVRGEVCNLIVQVKGLHVTDHFDRPVLLLYDAGESSLCNLSIRDGRGSTGEVCCNRQAMGTARIPYEAIREIQIPLAAGRKLCCKWENREDVQTVHVQPYGNEKDSGNDHVNGDADDANGDMKDDVNRDVCQAGEIVAVTQREDDIESVLDEVDTTKASFPLEDKWNQLWEVYPHITPFGDEREYLSIGPSDFVILPAPYYRLVNNSFLLHGYHNYGHLILWRTEWKGELRYYIGVPGNYYEKEKQVAIMFGFESFECKTEPADWGTYGYYMVRVEV